MSNDETRESKAAVETGEAPKRRRPVLVQMETSNLVPERDLGKMPVLQAEHLGIDFGGLTAVDDLNIAMGRTEISGLIGPNGAGKTSLARAVSGRLRLTSGAATLLGEDVGRIPPDELATRVALVSKSSAPSIRPGSTVRDLVRTGAWGVTVHRDEQYEELDDARCADLLSAFGVARLADREFSTLSEGESQRVLLARSLMPDPEVLILAEPTAGLDLGARELLVGALEEIIAGPRAPQLILVTHQLEEIPSRITHAALMAGGAILHQGPVDEVITGVGLSAAYELPLTAGRDSGRWWARGLPRS